MKIYTKTGDDGTTSLAGGSRLPKYATQIEAYGTVDELISWIGLISALPENNTRNIFLLAVQSRLMHCAAILASGPGARTDKMIAPSKEDIEGLEKEIDAMEAAIDPLNSFVLPGGSVPVANIHIGRCVCRRAERAILRLDGEGEKKVNPFVIKYINRLSDYLFVLARKVAFESGVDQPKWIP
jgi:cob(I)alamin adenosyltransferase